MIVFGGVCYIFLSVRFFNHQQESMCWTRNRPFVCLPPEVDGQFSGRFVASLASIARVESEKNLVTRFVDKEEIEEVKQHLPNACKSGYVTNCN